PALTTRPPLICADSAPTTTMRSPRTTTSRCTPAAPDPSYTVAPRNNTSIRVPMVGPLGGQPRLGETSRSACRLRASARGHDCASHAGPVGGTPPALARERAPYLPKGPRWEVSRPGRQLAAAARSAPWLRPTGRD